MENKIKCLVGGVEYKREKIGQKLQNIEIKEDTIFLVPLSREEMKQGIFIWKGKKFIRL